jgi:hypothetical protein
MTDAPEESPTMSQLPTLSFAGAVNPHMLAPYPVLRPITDIVIPEPEPKVRRACEVPHLLKAQGSVAWGHVGRLCSHLAR